MSQRLSSWTSQQWFFPDPSNFSFIHQCFQTLQTKWKNLAVDWDGGLPSIIWDLGIFWSIFEVKWLHSYWCQVGISLYLETPGSWKDRQISSIWKWEGRFQSENSQSCKLLLRWPHCDAFVLMQRHSRTLRWKKKPFISTILERWINSKCFNVWLQHK